MIHIFCPTFPHVEYQGTYEFESIDFRKVQGLLWKGYWMHPEAKTRHNFTDPNSWPADTPETEVLWRHNWDSIRAMLNSNGFQIPAHVERRGHGSGVVKHAMALGDIGIVFRGIGRVQLNDKTLTPADFEFYSIERVE